MLLSSGKMFIILGIDTPTLSEGDWEFIDACVIEEEGGTCVITEW
jgi:hypothetical protein